MKIRITYLLMVIMTFCKTISAEERRIEGGVIRVIKNDESIRLIFTPSDFNGQHVDYVYFIAGEFSKCKKVIIYQRDMWRISMFVDKNGGMVRVGVGLNNCYCVLSQCNATCALGRMVFGLWTKKLMARKILQEMDITQKTREEEWKRKIRLLTF